jgi:hypothetical protein
MNAAQLVRLRMIDFLLDHYGHFNRPTLMDYFGLSQPQVSMDIKWYMIHAPENIEYDKSLRTYRKSANFTRTFP